MIRRGFSLVEIIVAVGILSILAAAVAYTVGNSNSNFSGTTDDALKARFAQQGYEAIKAIRDKSWKSIADATASTNYDVIQDSTGIWTLGTTLTTRGGLTRKIIFYDVQRDANGAIVTSGGTPDYNTRRVAIQITGGTTTYQIDTYLANLSAYRIRQTAWNGTTGTLTWSGTDLSNNWYIGNNMTGTSTTGALTMVAGQTVAYATSSTAILSYSGTSHAIKNRNVLTLQWTQNIPTSCILRLYLEATNTVNAGSPDYTVGTMYGPITASTSGTATTSANIITTYPTIADKKYVRYGVSMRSCSGQYPTLYGVTMYAD